MIKSTELPRKPCQIKISGAAFFWIKLGYNIMTFNGTCPFNGAINATKGSIGNTATGDYIEIANDGKVTLYGNARVTDYIQLGAGAARAPGIKPATYVTHGIGGAWEFAKNADNEISINFTFQKGTDVIVPLKFVIGWSCVANTGNVKWELQYLWRKLNEDTGSSTPDETVIKTVAVSSTANGYQYTIFDAAVLLDSDDRYCNMKISRIGSDGELDTADDVAHYVGIGILYAKNKLGDSI